MLANNNLNNTSFSIIDNTPYYNPYAELNTRINTAQDTMSKLQAIPCAGHMLVSPIKSVLSKAEIAAGCAFCLIGNCKKNPTQEESYVLEATPLSNEGYSLMQDGLEHWIYSALNTASCGLVGLGLELRKLMVEDSN